MKSFNILTSRGRFAAPAQGDLAARLLTETGRIIPKFAQAQIPRDGWRRHIPFADWEDEMGYTLQQPRIEPNVIDQNAVWSRRSASVAQGPGGVPAAAPNPAIDPNTYQLNSGFTLTPVTPADILVTSEEFSVEDIRASLNFGQQLGGYLTSMNDGIFYEIGRRLRVVNFALAENLSYITDVGGVSTYNVFADKTNPANASASDITKAGGLAVEATGVPSLDTLSRIYGNLIASPAASNPFGYTTNGDPVFPALCDIALKRVLYKDPTKLVRADVQFAFQGAEEMSPLLKPFTTPMTLEGFACEADANMPRLKWVAAAGPVAAHYEIVWKWATVAAGNKGTRLIVNPQWEIGGGATHGFIAVPTYGSMDVMVPRPVNYDGWYVPQMYTGQIIPLNIQTYTRNLLGKNMFLAAQLSMAERAYYPWTIHWMIAKLPTS